MDDSVVRVRHLSKRYALGPREVYRALRDIITDGLRGMVDFSRPRVRAAAPDGVLWALHDVSFDVRAGEVVGIIGRNGAGKTTLLKVLSRITEPTSGYAEIVGRAGSLLEVGTGFHPELTGRENIYLNGALLGMKQAEVRRKFDEIVAFAEVEKFLDTPVKRYSSGMYVRLAFAVAAHLEPEVLLVDEVLAVGDQAFQSKCMRKMQEVGESGRTILFVSHNLAAVRAICSRALWIVGGTIGANGPTDQVIEAYLRASIGGTEADLLDHPGRWAGRPVVLRRAAVVDEDHAAVSSIAVGDPLRVFIEVHLPADVRQVNVWAAIHDSLGDRIVTLSSYFQDRLFVHPAGRFTALCEVPSLPLLPGRYSLTLWVEHGRYKIDVVENAVGFDLVPADFFGSGRLPEGQGRGKVLMASTWSVAAFESAKTAARSAADV